MASSIPIINPLITVYTWRLLMGGDPVVSGGCAVVFFSVLVIAGLRFDGPVRLPAARLVILLAVR
jgi:hypothetical protein